MSSSVAVIVVILAPISLFSAILYSSGEVNTGLLSLASVTVISM